MSDHIWTHPEEGTIVSKEGVDVWIKFDSMEDIKLISLSMDLNGKKVPAVLNKRGLVYKYERDKKYGVNKVKVSWVDNKGYEIELKWSFVLLRYRIGIYKNLLQCFDFSEIKTKEFELEDLMNFKGIPVLNQNQVNKNIIIGNGRGAVEKLNLIELLNMRTPIDKNIENVKEYIFAYIEKNNRNFTRYEVVINGESVEKEHEKITNGILRIKGSVEKIERTIFSGCSYMTFDFSKNIKDLLETYITCLDRGYNLGVWGISHNRNKNSMYMKVTGKNYENGFFEGFKSRRTVVSNIEKYTFELSINGRIVGDRIQREFVNKFNLFLNMEEEGIKIKEVALIGKEGRVLFKKKYREKRMLNIREDIVLMETEYVVCVVKCSANKWVLTSPIWVE